MIQTIHRLFLVLVSAALVATFASCSGGGSADGDTTGSNAQGTGTVGILLTDKPADPSLFVSINASINRVELLGGNDNGRVVLYSGPTKTFDLLRLKNESVPLTFKDNVPAGKYCKIRLILSDLELVLADDTPGDLSDNATDHPKLPGNGKMDLVVRGCFYVQAGKTVTLQLDLDGANSIHIVGNKKGFKVRPVIFVDVLSQGFDAKLVRLEGEITRIDEQQKAFLLCNAIPAQQMNTLGCVEIYLGKDAAYFDNADFAGAPRPLSELLAKDKLGERVTVVGWPRFSVASYHDVEVPDDYFPPPGECKLWDSHLEAGEQAAPGDCDELSKRATDRLVLVTHDGVLKDRHHPWMAVDALAVELGTFLQLEGTVASDADTAGFDMKVSAGGPVITADTLAVAFQPGDAGYNGTRVVSKAGELLHPTQVVAPLPVQVDGTLELIAGNEPVLKAALVILDRAVAGSEQITGTVLTIGIDSLTLAPDADTVCGVASSALFVTLASDLDILTVTITSSGSEINPGGVIMVGQTVGMNGRCETGGYVTDNIVIVDDRQP